MCAGLSGVSRHVADADARSSRSSITDPIMMVQLQEYGAELPGGPAGAPGALGEPCPRGPAPGTEHLHATQRLSAVMGAIGAGRPGGTAAAGVTQREEDDDTGIVILAGGSGSSKGKGAGSGVGSSRSGVHGTPQPRTAMELHEQLLARYERRTGQRGLQHVMGVALVAAPASTLPTSNTAEQ